MIFSELYSAYYNTVAEILTIALEQPRSMDKRKMYRIIGSKAFLESAAAIESGMRADRWQLLTDKGEPITEHKPNMPLTTLQKRWLKAISLDPRIRLFDFDISGLENIEPLFTPQDIYVFDKYADGDPYEDREYIKKFRLILDAVKNKYPLKIEAVNRRGQGEYSVVMPHCLEYSQKDDKFRLITEGRRNNKAINLGRIISCRPYKGEFKPDRGREKPHKEKSLVIEVTDERRALERALLHFAHFRKEAESIGDNLYRVKINYSSNDETELVIRVLSFGPLIRVIEPESFRELIRDRLKRQREYDI